MTNEEKIAAYAEEIGVKSLSIDEIISSHRDLRDIAKMSQRKWLRALEDARQMAYQQVLDSNWIRVSDLKKMSLMELVDFLYEEEDIC